MSAVPMSEGGKKIAKDIAESMMNPADAPPSQKSVGPSAKNEQPIADFSEKDRRDTVLKLAKEVLRSAAESLLLALPATDKAGLPALLRQVVNRLSIDLRLSDRDVDSKKMLRDLLEKELTPPSTPDEVSKAHWRNDEETVGKVIDAIAALEEMIESERREVGK